MKILFFAVLFVTIVLLILFYDRIRQSKIFRSSQEKAAERAARKAAKEEEYFRRTSNKHYRRDEKLQFDKDYFKGDGEKWREDYEKRQAAKKTARRTTSSDGVTIIDQRQGNQVDKKIFEDGEGEYVEFEEV